MIISIVNLRRNSNPRSSSYITERAGWNATVICRLSLDLTSHKTITDLKNLDRNLFSHRHWLFISTRHHRPSHSLAQRRINAFFVDLYENDTRMNEIAVSCHLTLMPIYHFDILIKMSHFLLKSLFVAFLSII